MGRFFGVLAVLVALGMGLSNLTSGGRLIFAAPLDSNLSITIDSRAPVQLPPGGFTDAFVSWGEHTVVTETSKGKKTWAVQANLKDAVLVPASEQQCFVFIDVSEVYSATPGQKLPSDWRPRTDVLPRGVIVAPKHFWVTTAPPKVRHVPGEPAHILFPFDCEETSDSAVDVWMSRTFGGVVTSKVTKVLQKSAEARVDPMKTVSVEVTSEPSAAEVVVEGSAQVQVTPVTLVLAPGTPVLFRKDGFVPRAMRFPGAGPLSVTLARAATLDVTSTPAGASVTIDGHEVGQTPLHLTTLEPGLRQVTVRAPNFMSMVRSLEVGLERPGELNATLVAGAQVDLLTSPPEATFSIDGAAFAPVRKGLELEAGRPHYLVLTGKGRLPKWAIVGPFGAGAHEAPVFELDDRSQEGLDACARQAGKSLQRVKGDLGKAQKALVKAQRDGRDTGKVERQLTLLQDESNALSAFKPLCGQ